MSDNRSWQINKDDNKVTYPSNIVIVEGDSIELPFISGKISNESMYLIEVF
jgi:hypothetical protein